MMDVCFALKSRHGVIQSRCPLSASNRYPENRNEGPIATLTHMPAPHGFGMNV